MAKIKEFTRQNLKEFVSDLEVAIKAVSEKYGVAFKSASGRFTAETFGKKFEFFTGAEKGETGMDIKYKANLEYAALYGMPKITEKDYNKIFVSQGQTFRFVGINSRGRRFPIVAQNLNTKKYFKFGESMATQIANSKTWHNK